MKMKIPITGTVVSTNPVIMGDSDDPIKPISIDLGNVSWTLIELDLENEEMTIEITPSESFSEPDLNEHGVQKVDKKGNHVFKPSRKATKQEKDKFIEHARNHSLERVSKEALYALSKSPRLKNPFKEAV